MKHVFPRFCNPVNPKEPTSPEPLRPRLEVVLPTQPFNEGAEDEIDKAECCLNSTFLPSMDFTESDNP